MFPKNCLCVCLFVWVFLAGFWHLKYRWTSLEARNSLIILTSYRQLLQLGILFPFATRKLILSFCISDWTYVNMGLVSVYRSYTKCVLGTKTLTLPTQDNGWLYAPSTELCNYHDNHSQQRPDSAQWLGQVRTTYVPVKASTEHCCLVKGLCQNSPLPTPLFFPPGLIHPPTVRAVPGPSSCTDQDGKPRTLLDITLGWSRATPGARRKPSGHIFLALQQN